MSTSSASETGIWASAVLGDPDAFAQVFDLHHARVYRHALRMAVVSADAEDVTAMVFFEAWRKRHSVRVVDGSIVGWLLVTTTNIARNQRRALRRYEALLLRVHPEDVADHAPAVLESIDPARHEVNRAFTQLSPGDQQLLVLCLVERIPPTAVAQLLRLRPGTVRTRLSRAKTRLRGLLNDSAPTLEEPAL